MYIVNNTESLNELKIKLRNKYPQLSDSDLNFNAGNELDMLRMIAYKLGMSKQEMLDVVEKL